MKNKEKKIAIRWVLCLGFVGGHYFYLQKYLPALLNCLLGLVAIIFMNYYLSALFGSKTKLTDLMIHVLLGTIAVPATLITLVLWAYNVINLLSISQEKFDLIYNPYLFIPKSDALVSPIADQLVMLEESLEKGEINFEEFEKRKMQLLRLH